MSHHPEHTWGHTVPFGEAYHNRAVETLEELHGQAGLIAEVAGKAVEALRGGNKVYANVVTGHMPTYELVNEREGNPALFEFTGSDMCTPEQYAAMRPGDVLMTNRVDHEVRLARDRGVYVYVFTTCYTNNRWAPEGKVNPNPDNLMPEDVASQVIQTPIPWDQGLIHIPEIPYMALFPGSANVSCSIHWMVTAEVAQALATGGTPDGVMGKAYLEILLNRLTAIKTAYGNRLRETAVVMANRIIGGGRYWVKGRNEGVASEVSGVAQGLMMANGFEPRPAAEGGDRDIFLVTAVSRNDATDVALAETARGNGNLILGIGPGGNDQLEQLCDGYFHDYCPEDAGVLAIEGRTDKICPATGILNNILVQSLSAQMVDEMCRRGAVPYFYMGVYRVGGGTYNGFMSPYFRERGY